MTQAATKSIHHLVSVHAAAVQVVVDLPEKRRNRSPQRQAPPPPQPPHPAHSALPAESLETSEASTATLGEGLQRPHSSRPEGCVGWVEADMAAGPVATFAAAAQDSAATGLSSEAPGEPDSYTAAVLCHKNGCSQVASGRAGYPITQPCCQSDK